MEERVYCGSLGERSWWGDMAAGGWRRKLGDHISTGSRETGNRGRLEPSKPASVIYFL